MLDGEWVTGCNCDCMEAIFDINGDSICRDCNEKLWIKVEDKNENMGVSDE